MAAEDFYYGSQRAEVAALLPTGARRVLEIGCGNGAFRPNLPKDIEYWGVEPTEGPAREAGKHLTKVFLGIFDDHVDALPDGYFDLIICNDVIEHMVDHDRFLEQIKGKMAPGAVLVGSVPNVRLLTNLLRLVVKRDWEYADSGILDTTHLRFFTRKSLMRIFARHHYAIESFTGLNRLGKTDAGLAGLTKKALSLPFAWVLGSDVLYVQFGFRVRLAG